MAHLRVLLGLTNAPDHSLEELAGSVHDNLFGKPAFPTPPVMQGTLQAQITAFTDAIAAQMQGGTAATAAKNFQRDALIAMLRQLAGYVQVACNNDLATLLSSGFEAVNTHNASSPLANPIIRSLDNGNSGQLLIRVTPVPNAKCYEVRYAAILAGGVTGPWQNGGLFSNSRAIPVNGLTPGTSYTVEVRAIGGSTGSTDWSDPVGHMSM